MTGSLHAAAADYLDDHPDRVREVYAFGGTGVIENAVLAECRAMLP